MPLQTLHDDDLCSNYTVYLCVVEIKPGRAVKLGQ